MDYSAVNTIWVLLGAALVFFMQPGFAMVETGFTRAKNAGNIIMKNLLDLSIGAPVYWIVGFGIMFGTGNGFFGAIDFLSTGDYSDVLPDGVPFYAFLIFQTVFCATAATIVSGAMAERTKFSSYCLYSFLISLVVYPISGHWIWGGGFLSQMGFHDFAGSTAVHMVGGVAALVGAKILGARIGKYNEDGSSNAILGHSLTLGALGVFILWFCWFGFNGCSTVSMEGDAIVSAGKIFITTNLAAAVATVTAMFYTWAKYKKPENIKKINYIISRIKGYHYRKKGQYKSSKYATRTKMNSSSNNYSKTKSLKKTTTDDDKYSKKKSNKNINKSKFKNNKTVENQLNIPQDHSAYKRNKFFSEDPFSKPLKDSKDTSNDPRNGPMDNVRRRYPKIEQDEFSYEGEWKNRKRDGVGVLIWKNVAKFIGEFLEDRVWGFGILHHDDGDEYMGYWEEFQAKGVGKYHMKKIN